MRLTGLLSYQYALMVTIRYGLLYSWEGEEGRCNCEIRNSQLPHFNAEYLRPRNWLRVEVLETRQNINWYTVYN